ncbi:MAG: diacylglycerol kinase [Rhodospirillum sp.]|nr:diacylglycerol kinase [Rhodospirillum sp.]MCF8491857.1 diacylglycerol kinase [Rhodospirillum sp.]MCF8501142.1 diacylglycerol kinase [Rhodospirillum sp.]
MATPWVPLLLNPRAGSLLNRDVDALAQRLADRLEREGIRVEVHLVPGKDVNALVREALSSESPPLAVIVGGGDGTLLAAAEALIGGSVPLGILPLGTMNFLARDLMLPLDPDAAVEVMISGLSGRVDVARVNGRPFLNQAVLGVKSAITRFREKRRGSLSPWHWAKVIWHALKVYRRSPRSRLEVVADGEVFRVQVHALGVSNNLYTDTPGPALSRDRLNGGRLGLYIAGHRGRLGLLKQLAGLLFGRWKTDRNLIVRNPARVSIETKRSRIHFTMDGEPVLGASPLVFTLDPAALPVLAASGTVDRLSDPRPSPLGRSS